MKFEHNNNNIALLNQELNSIPLPEGAQYQLPPNSLAMLKGEFINYKSRSELITKFSISKNFSNPQGTVQGGIIAACFDDTFGPLGVATSRSTVLTIDMAIQYIRPIPLDEEFYIKTDIVSIAKSTIYMQAEAYNQKGKLLAKASTNQLIVR